MIDLITVPQHKVTPATVTDPDQLIGKTPKMFLKAGEPLRDNQLTQIVLIQIPVLTDGMDRDGRITDADVKMIEVDAAIVPLDAVTDAVGFLQQEVFTQMAVTHDWFLTKNNGDLTLRRAVPKARTTPTREEKATDNGLYALLDRYGAALVGARIERIWGKPDALAGVTPVVRPVDPVA